MKVNSLCQYLEWDSEFFGFKIARITGNSIYREALDEVLAWCRSNDVRCLYFLCEAGDERAVRLAEDNLFRFVDIRVTLEGQLSGDISPIEKGATQGIIRPHALGDIPALRAIAGVSHRDSRFYYDSNFMAARCDALYETWIERSCNGYADTVLVAELEGSPVGYITCHLRDDGAGQIGLVGVGEQAQGKGLGKQLVGAALNWFAEKEATRVVVVTQGRNTAAQRLYQRCGFLTQQMQLWYHRWRET